MFVTRYFGAFSKFAFGNLQDRFFNTSRCFVRNLKDFSSMLQAFQEKNQGVFADLLGTIYPVCWMFFIIHFLNPCEKAQDYFSFLCLKLR